MNIRLHKGTVPTQEMVEKISHCSAKGEELFETANLRQLDKKWWVDATQGIVHSLKEAIVIQKTTDDKLADQIPQSEYQSYFSESQKAKVRADYIKKVRNSTPWLLTLGFLLRDCERLEIEALHMGDKVIQSRGQLRSLAVVIALILGCASIPEVTKD